MCTAALPGRNGGTLAQMPRLQQMKGKQQMTRARVSTGPLKNAPLAWLRRHRRPMTAQEALPPKPPKPPHPPLDR